MKKTKRTVRKKTSHMSPEVASKPFSFVRFFTRPIVVGILCISVLILYLGSFIFSYSRLWKDTDPLLMTDVARLIPLRVKEVDTVHALEDLKVILADAKKKGLKVSISGSRHSQGGHTYYQDAVVLDMRGFNKIVELDTRNKVIRVQSGARWKDVQEYINPYGLAVKVMQSSYIFTIGGSLSANAHGRDIDTTSLVETVRSFHLLTADGNILNVSRTEHPELFKLVIGGYGLFGVILDADLNLATNDVYEQKSTIIDYTQLPEYFAGHVKNNPAVQMLLIRPSIASDTFLRELVVTTWNTTKEKPEDVYKLRDEEHVIRDRFFFSLSRKFDWAKDLRWSLQKKVELGVGEKRIVSRNNAMRPPLAPLEFLDYYSDSDTDILQEYYIPIRNFVPFMDSFREILLRNNMNVISSTIRYVKANDETYMAYAPKEDAFAIIQMSNVGLSKDAQMKTEKTTRELVDAAIRYQGTYYLTYQLYPTKAQMKKAYPNTELFFTKKKEYDPGELFMNTFYEKYAQ